jgi:hypothetical protein
MPHRNDSESRGAQGRKSLFFRVPNSENAETLLGLRRVPAIGFDVELTGLTQDTELPRNGAPEWTLLTALALLLGLVVTACGDGTEAASEWEAIWRNTTSTVADAITSDLTVEQCQDMLGYLRVQKTVLSPVPLDDLEAPVDRWFGEAEGIFFECDLDGEAARESLVTLEATGAEIEAVFEVER